MTIFFQTNLPLRYEKIIPVDVLSHNECLHMYGVDVRKHGISFVVECLKPRVGQFQKVNTFRNIVKFSV